MRASRKPPKPRRVRVTAGKDPRVALAGVDVICGKALPVNDRGEYVWDAAHRHRVGMGFDRSDPDLACPVCGTLINAPKNLAPVYPGHLECNAEVERRWRLATGGCRRR